MNLPSPLFVLFPTPQNLHHLHQFFRRGDVFDDLGGERADADVAEVRERGSVGKFDDGFHHERDVAFGVLGKVVKRAHAGNVFRPARERFVDGNKRLAQRVVARHVFVNFSVRSLVGDAYEQIAALPFVGGRKRIELVDDQILITAVAERICLFHAVAPADHALTPGNDAKFEFFQAFAKRMLVVHLREENVRADLGIVSLAAAHRVHGLRGNAGGLEKFRRKGVRSGNVRREAVAFVEPVGLPEFADDVFTALHRIEHEIAHVANRGNELLSGVPVNFDHFFAVKLKRRSRVELREVEIGFGENAVFNGGRVPAHFGGGEFFEKFAPKLRRHAANVLNRALGAVHARVHFFFKNFLRSEEIRVGDLPLPYFVAIRGRDSASRGAARQVLQDVHAVILKREVEHAVRNVAEHRALVDAQARINRNVHLFERARFPVEFARVGNDTGTDGEHGNILFDHARGKQIELEPADGVPGIGAAVHFHNDGNDPALAGFGLKLADDFGNEASLAFVSGADSGVCNELAAKRNECHGLYRKFEMCCKKLTQKRVRLKIKDAPSADKKGFTSLFIGFLKSSCSTADIQSSGSTRNRLRP